MTQSQDKTSSTAPPETRRRKLVDYTQVGKHNVLRNQLADGKPPRRSSNCSMRSARTSQRSLHSSFSSLDSTDFLLDDACEDDDKEKVEFYLKIPSKASRKVRSSDLREKFGSSRAGRPSSKKSLIQNILSEPNMHRVSSSREKLDDMLLGWE